MARKKQAVPKAKPQADYNEARREERAERAREIKAEDREASRAPEPAPPAPEPKPAIPQGPLGMTRIGEVLSGIVPGLKGGK